MVKIKVYAATKILILIFVALFLLVTFTFFFNEDEQSIERSKWLKNDDLKQCMPWRRWMKSVKKCTLDGIETSSAWYMLDKIIENCVDQEKLRSINIRVLTNIDDTKLAIFDLEANTPCTSVTFGIGNNVHGEQSLLKSMPQCNFYGADPIKESGTIFKTIGRYDIVAIGTETWFGNATIKINSTRYLVEVPFISFADYMMYSVNKTTVDFLFMDIAGYEYPVLGTFYNTSILERITICQITVELHGPPGMYGMTKLAYDNFVFNFVKYTPFVPLWSKTVDRHTKVYFFNSNSKYCVEKYVLQMC